MNKRGVFVLGVAILVAVGCFVVYKEIQKADSVAFDSCVRSIHRKVAEDRQLALPHSEDWTYLSDSELRSFEERQLFGDCHQLRSNKLVDIWGEKIRIVYRNNPDSTTEFRVWSKGADKVAGTQDDIISPSSSLESVKHLSQIEP
ncbi:MAG: hypothetical protein WKF34_01600 [Pyrinomonadaceae bacterium]